MHKIELDRSGMYLSFHCVFIVSLTLVISSISLHCWVYLNLWLKEMLCWIQNIFSFIKDDLVYLQFMRSNFPFKNLNGCVRKRSFCDTNIYVIDIFLTCSCSEKELSSMPSFNQVMWGLLIRLFITT